MFHIPKNSSLFFGGKKERKKKKKAWTYTRGACVQLGEGGRAEGTGFFLGRVTAESPLQLTTGVLLLLCYL